GHDLVRGIAADAILGYSVSDGGAPRVRTRLLSSVVAWASSDARCAAAPVRLRTTKFSYSLATDNRVPQLTAVDVFGRGDDGGQPATGRPVGRFTYGTALNGDRLSYGAGYTLALPATHDDSILRSSITLFHPYYGGSSVVGQTIRDVTGDNRAD